MEERKNYVKRTQRDYSMSLKLSIVKEIESGELYTTGACRKYGIVNPESNYCFGEGGAGTYSDGKLYTRFTKRGNVLKSLQWFHYFGAIEKILQEAHPHIGTNKLPGIITKMREAIIECLGEVWFNSKVTDILLEGDSLTGVRINDEYNLDSKALILATGHSARDIFELHERKGIFIEAKPFALGVRIEHPQKLIDSIQYHCSPYESRNDYLPKSSYLPGTNSAQLNQILPIEVYASMRKGFQTFGQKMKGYYTEEAIVLATESRTSSPVRIPRI